MNFNENEIKKIYETCLTDQEVIDTTARFRILLEESLKDKIQMVQKAAINQIKKNYENKSKP